MFKGDSVLCIKKKIVPVLHRACESFHANMADLITVAASQSRSTLGLILV